MKHEATRSRLTAKKLLLIPAAAAVLLAGMFILHHTKLRSEAHDLQVRGWRYAAAAGDYTLGYCTSGNDAGAHRIIAIADLGVNDYSIRLRNLCSGLVSGNLVVCMDRAGCGISVDTKTPQTAEQIVADYRTALKNANIQPPYILLPHAFGSVYAAYWESMYPEEIEGIFFLDGTCLPVSDPVSYSSAKASFQKLLADFGLQRLKKYPLPAGFSGAEMQNARMLNIRSAMTSAQISEIQLAAENCRTADAALVTNDIPKAFINAASFKTPEDWLAADDFARTFRRLPDLTDAERLEAAADAVTRAQAYEAEVVLPYLERLGACTYYALPGDSEIYMQKPMQCAVLFSQFLTQIESKKAASN